jgi:disulfide bond formation protein DsbB
MPLTTLIADTAGWTLFSGVFSMVFPLVVLSLILILYTVALLRRGSG